VLTFERQQQPDHSPARKKGRQVSMEPMRGRDFVHALMVKLNRVSIAAILTAVAIYGLVVYRGATTTATVAQGSGTSGAVHVATSGITSCAGGSGTGSNDSWPLPVRGPR
jgi:hypothetical protein